jgi:hypothetical protein
MDPTEQSQLPEITTQQVMNNAAAPDVQAYAQQQQGGSTTATPNTQTLLQQIQTLLQSLGGSSSSGTTSPATNTGSAVAPTAQATSALQQYAQQQVQAAFPNDPNAWDAFNWIVNDESGWNPTAQNPNSSASGLMQFLSSTAPSYGLPAVAAQADPQSQINAGIKYIAARYGTPSNAYNFHISNGWY